MESNQKTQWYVGLFVVIGLVLVLVSIFMLGGDKSLFKSYVHIKANFDQVQGLNKGSVVSLSGVTIGNVEEISFIPGTNRLEVLLRIEQSFLSQIPNSSQVEIRTQGALGDKFVFVIPGTTGQETLKDGSVIEVAKATDIINIISERGKETERVFDIINNIYKITTAMSADNRIEKMMQNFSEASLHIKDASFEAQKMTKNMASLETQTQLKSSVEKLDHILTKIDRGQGTLGALVNDSTLHTQLKSLLGGSQRKEHIKSLIRTSIEKSTDTP